MTDALESVNDYCKILLHDKGDVSLLGESSKRYNKDGEVEYGLLVVGENDCKRRGGV